MSGEIEVVLGGVGQPFEEADDVVGEHSDRAARKGGEAGDVHGDGVAHLALEDVEGVLALDEFAVRLAFGGESGGRFCPWCGGRPGGRRRGRSSARPSRLR